jgi:hypothetical protein
LIKKPFILDNKGDLQVFATINDVLAYTEPVDVEEGEYEAFDAEGRLILLSTEPSGRLGNRKTIITKIEEPPRHAQELRKRLTECMRRGGSTSDGLLDESLASVVARFTAWQRARSLSD